MLVEEFLKQKHILRGRFSSKITAQTKADAWAKVMNAVNQHNPHIKRDIENIKKKWENLLSSAKKDIIDYKKELRKPVSELSMHYFFHICRLQLLIGRSVFISRIEISIT